MLKIVHIPHPVLVSPTVPVTIFDSVLKKLAADMEETLDACVDHQGVGLAATQIGRNISMFIMKPSPDSDSEVVINPQIVETIQENPTLSLTATPPKRKKKKETPLEGCLSIPRIWSPVKRAYKILVEYQDLEGKSCSKWYEDFEAIIVQHEIDHLNGVLFTQRSIEQGAKLYEEKNGELEEMKADL